MVRRLRRKQFQCENYNGLRTYEERSEIDESQYKSYSQVKEEELCRRRNERLDRESGKKESEKMGEKFTTPIRTREQTQEGE